ncbi:MAG: hypothetical protein EOP48_22895 [Sphingobacteriales bacterium]|nr:MAG: hypothetical protein EOP48_22895 [Sphingobacteriales bacterium]
MKDPWSKIKTWLTKNHPEIICTLNVGASLNDYQELELTIGTSMPDDFKEFYTIHNGQLFTHLCLFDGDILLSVCDIIREWKQWNDILPIIHTNCIEQFGSPAESNSDPGIKGDWWNPLWIPITANGSGDNICIDLDPSHKGRRGQIIRMCHDDPQRELLAPSFRQWISNYIADLENGIYEASNDIGWGEGSHKGKLASRQINKSAAKMVLGKAEGKVLYGKTPSCARLRQYLSVKRFFVKHSF